MKPLFERARKAPSAVVPSGIATSFLLLAALVLAPAAAQAQCVNLTTLGAASTQNFDTLSNTAGSTTNNLVITGWFMTETGGGARDNEQYAVDTGAINTGDTFSYGAAGNPERALGSLRSGTLIATLGACYTNNTGATITTLNLAYTGEQWRLGTINRTDRLDFQYSLNATDLTTGSWTDVDTLDFVSPFTATVGARDGNAAGNRTALSASIGSLAIANGATFWIRWTDFDATGADDGLAIDDFSLTPSAPVTVNLSVNNVALDEGNTGTTSFTFTVSLSAPAGPGGVTFDIATANSTAQAPGDFSSQSLTGQTIPAGSSTYSFTVLVNGDTEPEGHEAFFVNVTNVTGATVTDGQGQGVIYNDDLILTPIHDIQGPGASSPVVGTNVSTSGVVTGVKSNGFFMQEPDATVDADPATSEGIFVFTSAAPPPAAAVGNLVHVNGTVTEFVPASDPLQPPLTELTSPTVLLISTGHPLPTAVTLTGSMPSPSGPFDQLERLEGMRVSIASLSVTGATQGSINESNASAASTGVFFGTVTGTPRPFREAGIEAPNPPPAGTVPPIPRWDGNPELLRVDSDGLVGSAALEVSTGAIVTGLAGPLDYAARRYTVLPDPASPPAVSGGASATAVTVPGSNELTVATYNMQRFYDTVDDTAIGEPVLTAAAFDRRLDKASRAIRQFLRTPDIIGVIEMENLSTLQTLAARISADAIAAGDPDPQYVAHLVEGNDSGGIDVGLLVKAAQVSAATPRVAITAVTQENLNELFTNPDASTELLNDRPPLVLEAVVNFADRPAFPLTVIVNHLRSLTGVDDVGPGSNGWPTAGERIRAKRHAQATSLANLVQLRQTASPTERIVLLGDFNAFEFNDGLVHVLGTIAGTPAPDNETAIAGDAADLVDPDMSVLTTTAPDQRYSYVEKGNAQSLDHILLGAATITAVDAYRIEHARIGADFPETARNTDGDVLRLSDHDPIVAYLRTPEEADLSVTIGDSPDPVQAGNSLTYTITVTNAGPDSASNVSLSATLAAGTTFTSLSSPAGWSCTTPAVGSGGTVSCSHAALAVGNAEFTLTVTVDPSLAGGTVLSQTATVSSDTSDATPANDSATETTTVASSADLSVSMTDSPDPVTAGQNITYTITAGNAGPSHASTVNLGNTLPSGTTFVSLSSPAAWSCTTPPVGATGTVSCDLASFAPGSAVFTLVVATDSTLASGTVISHSATIGSSTTEALPGDETATTTTTVNSSAGVSLLISDSPDPVAAGATLTYTITVQNAGPGAAANLNLTDTLPPGTEFASLSAPPGWACSTPAVGSGGTVSCTLASMAPGSAEFILAVIVDVALDAGSVLSNSAAVSTTSSDPDTSDNSATATTTLTQSADLSVTVSDAPDPAAPGTQLAYTIVLGNAGPSLADNAVLSDTLPAGTRFVSLSHPVGWSCTTPAVGAAGAVSCSQPQSGVGDATFILTVALDADIADGTVLSNTATAGADTADPDGSNNSATATTTINAIADLSVLAVDTPDPVTPGTTLSYAISLTNAGPSNAANATLDHTLPADTDFVSLSAPAGWSCSTPALGAGGSIACSHASMAPGNAAFTLVLQVDAAATPGDTIGSTFATGSDNSDPTADNSISIDTTVGPASADLSVTLADTPDPVLAGAQLSYTLNLQNAGPSHAADVVLGAPLPAGTRFVSLSAGGFACTTPAVGETGAIECTQASMAAGAIELVLVVSVDADVPAGSTLTTTATATSETTDPAAGNESATAITTVAAAADLSVTLVDTPDPVAPGTDLAYAVGVDNAGPSHAADAAVSVTLPAGTGFVSLAAAAGWSCTTPAVGANGPVDCTLASMAPGTAAFTLVVSVPPDTATGTSLSASATVATSADDATPANNTAGASTAVAAAADLSVAMTDTPDPATAGETLQYTIDVSNAGPSHAADVHLVDTLPAGTRFVSLLAPAGWNCTTPAVGSTGLIDCGIDALDLSAATFTLVVTIDADAAPGTVLDNTASISTSSADANAGNNSATASTTLGDGLADLAVTKTVSAPTVAAGGTLVYTIVVTNDGPAHARDVIVDDPLPAGTRFAALTAAAGFVCNTPAPGAGGTVSCGNDAMAPGSATFTLTVDVDAATAGGTVLSNTATLTSSTPDSGAGDNSATATSTVLAPSAVSASKSVAGEASPGAALIYTIVLHNSGDAAQTDNPGDEFVDVLPAGLALVSASASSGTATANLGAGTVTWNGAIPSGGTITITIHATIDAGIADGTLIVNQGTVRFDADGDGSNEASALTDDPATAAAGDGTTLVVDGGSVAPPPPPPPAVIPATSEAIALLLALLLTLTAAFALRGGRQH